VIMKKFSFYLILILILSGFVQTMLKAQVVADCPLNIEDNSYLLISFPDSTTQHYIDSIRQRYSVSLLDVDSLQCVPRFYRWKLTLPLTVTEADGSISNFSTLAAVAQKEKPKGKDAGGVSLNIKVSSGNTTGTLFDQPVAMLPTDCISTRYANNFTTLNPSFKCAVIDGGLAGTGGGPAGTGGGSSFVPFHWDVFAPTIRGRRNSYLALSQNGFNWQYGYDFTNAQLFQTPDSAGHGTHVAGIIAQLWKQYQITNAQMLIFKTQNQQGEGRLWDIARAIDQSICQGVKVVNMSLTWEDCRYTPDSLNQKDFIAGLMYAAYQTHKTLFVVAAGNNNQDLATSYRVCPAYYGSYLPFVLPVGAIDCADGKASFSNHNPNFVQISAPGVDIGSVWKNNSITDSTNWKRLSGTSQSTPQVTAAAVILAMNSGLPFDGVQVKNWLLAGSDKVTALQGYFNNGNILNIPQAYLYLQTVLPINLSRFDAFTTENADVQLHWETASEQQSDYFDVQISVDGKNWQLIQRVKAKGTSTLPVFYSFLHQQPRNLFAGATIFQYRLKMADLDGSFKYSKVREVELTGKPIFKKGCFPNPATDGIYIHLDPSLPNLTLRCINMSGQVVLHKSIQTDSFSEWQYLNLEQEGLKQGLYLIELYGNSLLWREKVLKK
jgi:subtilisin family serine protease